MEKYTGAKCPICSEKLTAEDDIVVCPECGAPHHRSCWQVLGHCGCAHLHAQHKTRHEDAAVDTEASARTERPPQEKKRCPACHAENNPDASFCSSCGAPLFSNGTSPFENGIPNPNEMPQGFHILFDPLGGVPADELIDDVPAARLGTLVGRNSAYYIPRFRELFHKNKRFFINFTAMLFDIPWFFFRKMYLQGVGIAILELALMFPTAWALVQVMLFGVSVTFGTGFWVLYYVCAFLQLTFRLVIGLGANTVYFRHCVGLAQQMQQDFPDEEAFRAAARKRGGTASVFVYIWLGLSLLYYFASSAIGLFL